MGVRMLLLPPPPSVTCAGYLEAPWLLHFLLSGGARHLLESQSCSLQGQTSGTQGAGSLQLQVAWPFLTIEDGARSIGP